eukprot:s448_g28.t1
MHIVVMALNCWWTGNCFIDLGLLERAPSLSQKRLLKRILSLVLADGLFETFEVPKSGRRFPQVLARLAELSDVVTKLGAGAGPYEATYPGHDVPLDNSRFIELEPYKSLNAKRLKVVGMGNFDATQFLSPELCMAYRFPDSLLFDKVPELYEYPQRLAEVQEVVSLAKGIFQGDHAGVEIARSAHEGLLRSAGLLDGQTRLVSSKAFSGDKLCQGLVIDDYFAVACVPKGLLVECPAEACFRAAKSLYSSYGILGFDDKDVKGERKANLIGASVNASAQSQDRGHVLAVKRYALSWVCLQLCQ